QSMHGASLNFATSASPYSRFLFTFRAVCFAAFSGLAYHFAQLAFCESGCALINASRVALAHDLQSGFSPSARLLSLLNCAIGFAVLHFQHSFVVAPSFATLLMGSDILPLST